MNSLIPRFEPYFLPVGPIGCLLLPGFSASSAEMRPLGDFLASKGYSVLGVRLAGHATHPKDHAHARWADWLDNVADGLALFLSHCTRLVLVGQSLGGVIALLSTARHQPHAVVAISPPYGSSLKPSWSERLRIGLHQTFYK